MSFQWQPNHVVVQPSQPPNAYHSRQSLSHNVSSYQANPVPFANIEYHTIMDQDLFQFLAPHNANGPRFSPKLLHFLEQYGTYTKGDFIEIAGYSFRQLIEMCGVEVVQEYHNECVVLRAFGSYMADFITDRIYNVHLDKFNHWHYFDRLHCLSFSLTLDLQNILCAVYSQHDHYNFEATHKQARLAPSRVMGASTKETRKMTEPIPTAQSFSTVHTHSSANNHGINHSVLLHNAMPTRPSLRTDSNRVSAQHHIVSAIPGQSHWISTKCIHPAFLLCDCLHPGELFPNNPSTIHHRQHQGGIQTESTTTYITLDPSAEFGSNVDAMGDNANEGNNAAVGPRHGTVPITSRTANEGHNAAVGLRHGNVPITSRNPSPPANHQTTRQHAPKTDFGCHIQHNLAEFDLPGFGSLAEFHKLAKSSNAFDQYCHLTLQAESTADEILDDPILNFTIPDVRPINDQFIQRAYLQVTNNDGIATECDDTERTCNDSIQDNNAPTASPPIATNDFATTTQPHTTIPAPAPPTPRTTKPHPKYFFPRWNSRHYYHRSRPSNPNFKYPKSATSHSSQRAQNRSKKQQKAKKASYLPRCATAIRQAPRVIKQGEVDSDSDDTDGDEGLSDVDDDPDPGPSDDPSDSM